MPNEMVDKNLAQGHNGDSVGEQILTSLTMQGWMVHEPRLSEFWMTRLNISENTKSSGTVNTLCELAYNYFLTFYSQGGRIGGVTGCNF
jgi:hypothetical protein